jgi:hypothetical protein
VTKFEQRLKLRRATIVAGCAQGDGAPLLSTEARRGVGETATIQSETEAIAGQDRYALLGLHTLFGPVR